MMVLWICFFIIFIIWALNKITNTRNNSNVCLLGKTALITGGNRGIGLSVALGLAARGCRVIIACRSNGEEARKKIINLTDNANIEAKFLDLTSFKSIRSFAKHIKETEQKIDILINNAAIGMDTNKFTEDGYPLTLQTNYMSHFLLNHLLLDLIKKSEKGRIIVVSSNLVYFQNLSLKSFKSSTNGPSTFWNGIIDYGSSKLALVIMTKMMAEKLKPFGISCNSLHPGVVETDIHKSANEHVGSIALKIYYLLGRILFFKDAEAGAQLILKFAMSKSWQNKTGLFKYDTIGLLLPYNAKNKNFCKQFWEETERAVKLLDSEKM